jgi:hypothetical protein
VKELVISKLQASFSPGLQLKSVWYPGKTLAPKELKHFEADIAYLNEGVGHLDYGYFAHDASERDRKQFLEKSIWCIAYGRGVPLGFVYNYFIGEHAGIPILHSGLVKIKSVFGKEFIKLPYAPLVLGNLFNFGPHYYSSISHLPIIIELFSDLFSEVYPAYHRQESRLRAQYRSVLAKLKDNYLIPILRYDSAHVDDRRYTVRNSILESEAGFNKQWNTLPKSNLFVCNQFVHEWLNVKLDEAGNPVVSDDLIQIGKVDFSVLGRPEATSIYNRVKLSLDHDFSSTSFQRLAFEVFRKWA